MRRTVLALLLASLLGGQQIVVIKKKAGGGGSPIAFDAKSASTGNGTGAAPSWTHTVGAGCTTNCILLVGVGGYNADAPTGCTFNGVAMTSVANNDPGNSATMSVWRLNSPATGAHTVTCSPAGYYRIAGAFSFSQVNLTTPVNQTANGSGSAANASSAITPTVANSWVIDFVYWPSGANPGATPTWSTQVSTVNDVVNTQAFGGATTGPLAASAQTNTWVSSSGAWAAVKVALSPE
jgi:hypothetical protein